MGGVGIQGPSRLNNGSQGMATEDKTNDQMDAEAEPYWALERTSDVVNRLTQIYEPYVDRRVSMMLRKNPNLDEDDAKQRGWCAMWRIAERFDHTRGVRCTTYAQRRVDGAIVDSARANDWVPTKVRSADNKRDKQTEESVIPAMMSLPSGFDREEDLMRGQSSIRMAMDHLMELVAGTSIERDIRIACKHWFDYVEIAKEMGVSVDHAQLLVTTALDRSKYPNLYLDFIKSLPAYKPSEGETLKQTVMFTEGAA